MNTLKKIFTIGFFSITVTVLENCAGQELRGKIEGVSAVIAKAKKSGAVRCAPKELAYAETHLERSKDELDLGNYVSGKNHLDIADQMAAQALQKSPAFRCVGKEKNELSDKDGDGVDDASDACPNEPEDKDGFKDADGCPDNDNDADGIPDMNDGCPNDSEDKDEFEDQDGCPDPDNDRDKITDVNDQCPDKAEDLDGDADEDGCPDVYKLVAVTEKKIELKQKIYFATGKAKILSRSFSLLNEVAKVLTDRPTFVIRIEGHTDSLGNDASNQRLSQGRAQAVRDYLVQQGITPNRLEFIGFGETKPIANNQTRLGRSMNRRVEFVIIQH